MKALRSSYELEAIGSCMMHMLAEIVTTDRGHEIIPVAYFLRGKTQLPRATNIFRHQGEVTTESRRLFFGHRPATVWLTGLSGAGKSTLAYDLEKRLLEAGHACVVLDGDNIRHHLNSDLGFSLADRKENIRRTAEVARLMNEAGLIVITAFISPYRADRAMAKELIGDENFIEVYVSTAPEVCEARDPKGLYAKARTGQITNFTGISSTYEPPLMADIELDTGSLERMDSTNILFSRLSDLFQDEGDEHVY